jgi:hypothetical protein
MIKEPSVMDAETLAKEDVFGAMEEGGFMQNQENPGDRYSLLLVEDNSICHFSSAISFRRNLM